MRRNRPQTPVLSGSGLAAAQGGKATHRTQQQQPAGRQRHRCRRDIGEDRRRSAALLAIGGIQLIDTSTSKAPRSPKKAQAFPAAVAATIRKVTVTAGAMPPETARHSAARTAKAVARMNVMRVENPQFDYVTGTIRGTGRQFG